MTTTSLPPHHLIQDAKVFGDPQLHADGDLVALAFAPDGTLWSVEEPGVVRHWNAQTGQELAWHCPSDLETLWHFSADARLLASACDDLSIWDVPSGNLLTSFPQKSWVTALAFYPDTTLVATGHDDGAVRLWDTTSQHLVREYKMHKRPVSALTFSADGKRLASAAEDKTIALWETHRGRLLGAFTGHTDRIPALAWHPDGDTLVSAGWDTTVRVWDTKTYEPIILLNTHAMQVSCLAFSNDGKLLATTDSDDAVHLWDYTTKKTLRVLKGQAADIRALAFSDDGRRLAFGGGDFLIHLWDTRKGQSLSSGNVRTYARTTFSLCPEGLRLATNGGGAATRVWNLRERTPIFPLPEKEVVQALAYSPDGDWIAGGCPKHVRLWEAATGQPGPALEGQEEPTTALAWSNDGATLASASSQATAVWLWRVADGEPILIIPDALDGCTIEGLAFHPRGRLLAVAGIDWLATGGSDGAIALWDLVDRCEVANFGGGSTCIAYDPTGEKLASASLDSTIVLWDVTRRESLLELTGHDGTVTGVAWSRDGGLLVSGGDDRTLRFWDTTTGEEVGFRELDTQIKGVRFSPDGRFVFTANGNTTCYQFEVERILANDGR